MNRRTRRAAVYRTFGAGLLGLLSLLVFAGAYLAALIVGAVLWGDPDADVSFGWAFAAAAAAGMLAAGSVWLAVAARAVRPWVRTVCALPGAFVLAALAYLLVGGLAG